ncbi:hypothetical protein ACRRTK_013858 [Alexandromys fortis]
MSAGKAPASIPGIHIPLFHMLLSLIKLQKIKSMCVNLLSVRQNLYDDSVSCFKNISELEYPKPEGSCGDCPC